MKRIKVESQINKIKLTICTIGCIIFSYFIYYLFFVFGDSSHNYQRSIEQYLVVFIPFILLFSILKNFLNKDKHLAEIQIDENNIDLIYKVKNKITEEIHIEKKDILLFQVQANVQHTQYRMAYYHRANFNIYIELKNGNNITVKPNISYSSFNRNKHYNCLKRILTEANNIPNFDLSLNTNSRIATTELNYLKQYGKKLPLYIKSKLCYKQEFMQTVILSICTISVVGIFTYLLAPYILIHTNETEKQYIEYIIESRYQKGENKLAELDKAYALIKTCPYIYYMYANYYYEEEKNYNKAIKYALFGIKNIKNTNIYRKKNKISALYEKDNTLLDLYKILSKSLIETGEHEKSIKYLSYLIENDTNKFSIPYHKHNRGIAYYHMGKFKEAQKDFAEEITILRNPEHKANKQKRLNEAKKWLNKCIDKNY